MNRLLCLVALLVLAGCYSVRTVAFTQRVVVKFQVGTAGDNSYIVLTSTDGYVCRTDRPEIAVGDLVDCEWQR